MLFVESRPDPLTFLYKRDGEGVLAIIVRTEGPSYRDVGAMMAFTANGESVGSLSSGCIEADLANHARNTLASGAPTIVRYGAGSDWIDLRLPCGGGMDVLLWPRPDKSLLTKALGQVEARVACTLGFDLAARRIDIGKDNLTGWLSDQFYRRLLPPLSFHIFGNGVEAVQFSTLVDAMGYDATLYSPDAIVNTPVRLERLLAPNRLPVIAADCWSAVVLFFHDHDWEPSILKTALESPAFYVGAQGSRSARAARDLALLELGVSPDEIARIGGPIGLIPSARDPGTLSVSVLAEILAQAQRLRAPAQ